MLARGHWHHILNAERNIIDSEFYTQEKYISKTRYNTFSDIQQLQDYVTTNRPLIKGSSQKEFKTKWKSGSTGGMNSTQNDEHVICIKRQIYGLPWWSSG